MDTAWIYNTCHRADDRSSVGEKTKKAELSSPVTLVYLTWFWHLLKNRERARISMPTGKMSTEACILQTTPGPYLQVLGVIWRQMMAHHVCLWEAVRKYGFCDEEAPWHRLPFNSCLHCVSSLWTLHSSPFPPITPGQATFLSCQDFAVYTCPFFLSPFLRLYLPFK